MFFPFYVFLDKCNDIYYSYSLIATTMSVKRTREFLELGGDGKVNCVKELLGDAQPVPTENTVKCSVKDFLNRAKLDDKPPKCIEGRVSPCTDQQVEIDLALDDLVPVDNQSTTDKIDGVLLPTDKTKEWMEESKQSQGVALTNMVLSLFEKDSNYESDASSSSTSSEVPKAD